MYLITSNRLLCVFQIWGFEKVCPDMVYAHSVRLLLVTEAETFSTTHAGKE
jgi:hypothetical protein